MVGIIAKKYQSKLICCLEKLARQFYIKYQLISYFLGNTLFSIYKPSLINTSDIMK